MVYFSKWPEVYATPNQKTSTDAQLLVDNLVCNASEVTFRPGKEFWIYSISGTVSCLVLHKQGFPWYMRSQMEWSSNSNERWKSSSLRLWNHIRLISTSTVFVSVGVQRDGPWDANRNNFEGLKGSNLRSNHLCWKQSIVTPGNTHELVRQTNVPKDHIKARYDIIVNHKQFNEKNLVWICNSERLSTFTDVFTSLGRATQNSEHDIVYRIKCSPSSKMKLQICRRLQLIGHWCTLDTNL